MASEPRAWGLAKGVWKGSATRARMGLVGVLVVGLASLAVGSATGATPPGTVVGWGANNDGQLGNGTTTNSSTPVHVDGIDGSGTLTGVVAVAAGGVHSLALRSDGSVVAWGDNAQGQLGNGTATGSVTPVQVQGVGGTGTLTGVVAIASAEHSLALRSDGSVVAWGYNAQGQLGDGTSTNSPTPVEVEGVSGVGTLTGIVAIAAGGNHSLALRSDGTVVSWGYNGFGQLGNGTTTNSPTPVEVEGVSGVGSLTGVVAIAAGATHSLALRSDGTVVAWGYNTDGELGDGTTTNSPTPVEVQGVGGSGTLSGVVAIAGGYDHSVALRLNGSVVAWGDNDEGQLGNGTTTNSFTPVKVQGVGGSGTLTGVVAIAVGSLHSVALRSDGTVVAWGFNGDGELGNATTTGSFTPVPVLGVAGSGTLAGVVTFVSGNTAAHTLAIQGAFARLSPVSIAFAGQPPGTASAAQTVTLTNDGPAPLTVSGETLTGAGAAAFHRSGDSCAGATLAAGTTCQLTLRFAPASAGAQSATLALQSTAANTLSAVTLSGTGVMPSSSLPSSSLPSSPLPPAAPGPVLSALKLSPRRFRAALTGATTTTAAVGKNGTIISYRDSEAAVTTFTVERPVAGMRYSGRCIKRPTHPNKKARRCTLYQTVGRFTHTDTAATNRLRFTGRINYHTLTRGRYRLQAIARKNRKTSKPRVASLEIKR